MSENLFIDGRPVPHCVAMIICNDVIEDKRTHNKTLVGLFNRIAVRSLPTQHPRFWVMISLTGGKGTYEVSLNFMAPSGISLAMISGKVPFPEESDVIDIPFELVGFPLPELGVYKADFLVDKRPVTSRQFHVVEQEQRRPQ